MKREYGVDLMKMMAMMMVVCHHVLQAGGVEGRLLATRGCFECVIEQLVHCFCYCAVDCFVLATGYIMCSRGFKYVRLFRLWRQVVGYSLALAVVAYFFFPKMAIGWRDWAMACLPLSHNTYWFFTQYAALFFLIPFLNRLMESLTGREAGRLLLTGLALFSFVPFVVGRDLFIIKWGYSCLWFFYLYLLGAALSRYGLPERIKATHVWLALGLGCVSTVGGQILGEYFTRRFGCGARFAELSYSYASPTLLLEAVALFLLCAKMRITSSFWQRLIVLLAPGTFIVYVVHSNPLFRQMTGWRTVFLPLADRGPLVATLAAMGIALVVFCGVMVIDVVRRQIVKWALKVV